MLRIGIIGCGKIAELRHAPEYRENPHCKLVGFYDFVPERAQALARQFNAKSFGCVDALLDSVDAVSVCSANNAHASTTIEALEAGKHVLCEKPMATNVADCEAMVAAARRTGKVLMLGHNQRFARAHVEARRIIAEGRLGRILSFHTVFGHSGPENWTGNVNPWFFDRKRAALGALADLGIHKTDLMHYLLGESIVRVSSIVKTQDKTFPDGGRITVEDNAMCLYETESGVMGTLHVSWTLYGQEDNSTRIYGTEGVLRLYDDPEYSLIFEHRGGAVERFALDRLATNDEQNAGGRTSTGVIDSFVDAVLFDKPSPASGEEAVKAMRVVFAAAESGRTGQPVQVCHETPEI